MAPTMEEIQESPVEGIQVLDITSIAVGNILESPPNDLPKAKATILKVPVGQASGAMKGIFGSGITWIVVQLEEKLISPIKEKWTLAGEGVPVQGNGMPTEPGHDVSNLENGASTGINSPGGFTDNSDQEGTDAGQVSLWSTLLDDLAEAAAEYLKDPKTYLFGLLIYGLHSSIGTLKEGFPKPTTAKKALWYLLFVIVATIFVLFTMLALVSKSSDKVKLLVKSIIAAGILMFGLNLALLYLKYHP